MRDADIPSFQTQLLAWYRKNARRLPWRESRDPYRIWVSEIMLQQTQVQTVIPYYERWLKRFPTLESLAKAPLSEVLKYWAGLGYYRRARMLHEGAKTLAQKVPGSSGLLRNLVPSEVSELLKIPGIGRYTAGAIASIAFEKRVPLLDGNVIRILTRLYAFKDDVGFPKTIQKLWKIAGEILPEKNIGDFNQALMELGATVCFPKNPKCSECDVASLCRSFKNKTSELYPVKAKKEMMESLKTAALVLRKKNKVLIRKQPAEARWGGLWMFPHWRDKKSMLEETGLSKDSLKRCLTVRHGFTKYRIELEVFDCATSPTLTGKWVSVSKLSEFAFPSPHQKIVKEILRCG